MRWNLGIQVEKGHKTFVKPQALNPFLPISGIFFPLNNIKKSLTFI